MMHFGIPAYRLPRADLMKEIRRVEQMGTRIILNHKVEDLLAEKAAGGFDAAFVAIGAHVAKHVDIPARDAARVMRSEERTSELQSLMRISYAVFCLKKKKSIEAKSN